MGTNDLLPGTGAAVTAQRLETMPTTIHSVSPAAARAECPRLATDAVHRHQAGARQ